jgi:hypothetical protein
MSSSTVTVRIPDELKAQLEGKAGAQNKSCADYLKELIRRDLAVEESGAAPFEAVNGDPLGEEKALLEDFLKYDRISRQLEDLRQDSDTVGSWVESARTLCDAVIMQHLIPTMNARSARIRICDDCGAVLIDGAGQLTENAAVHGVESPRDETHCPIKIERPPTEQTQDDEKKKPRAKNEKKEREPHSLY